MTVKVLKGKRICMEEGSSRCPDAAAGMTVKRYYAEADARQERIDRV